MRYKLIFPLVLAALLFACDGMYDNLEKYSGEIVYPAKYDTLIAHIGFERVELDLMKAGRIPSETIKMGKAKKTLIEYDGQQFVIDNLVSWLNIKDLTQSKLYRIRVFTIDEFENKSVPGEIAFIPFTSSDIDLLQVASPRIMLSPTSAIIDWPNGLSSALLNYCSLTFTYTDKDGVERTGERGEDSRFFVGNLNAGEKITIDMKYRVVPKMNNVAILDTIVLSQPIELQMPTGSFQFSPSERDILTANGISEFTADEAFSVEKLVFPIHTNSLQDLFYFPNLKELDLTGGILFPLPTLVYDRNDVKSTVGGGEWIPFMRKAGAISSGNTTALKDMLDAGMLEKIRYVPHSMGLDELLAPYVKSGIVELLTLPDEVLIPGKFLVDGIVQDKNWGMEVTFPAVDAPDAGLLENVFKVQLKQKNASFVFALPKEYQFNIQEYKYLKLKVFAPGKEVFNANNNEPYRILWPRIMNCLWAFSGNSSFGQEDWSPGKEKYKLKDEELQKWTELTIDMSEALKKHNRVIVINIGGEPSTTFTGDIIYYFAGFKFANE